MAKTPPSRSDRSYLAVQPADKRQADPSADHVDRLATLGTLAASIAHEINNILTPVLAYAQLASAKPDDLELRAKAIAKVITGVENASRIVRAMLGFAGSDDEPEHAEVGSVLDAALECIGRDLSKDGIELQRQVPRNAIVRMRPLALQQVFMNLILNARQALKVGAAGGMHATAKPNRLTAWQSQPPRRLTINAEPTGSGVIIRIVDTGPGIPLEIAGRLFEPFSTRPAKASAAGGHGLGLATCRQLIEQAGGTIHLTSMPGEGAAFTIMLPSAPRLAKAG